MVRESAVLLGQRSRTPSPAAHQQPPSPCSQSVSGFLWEGRAGMSRTVGVGVNDIHKLRVCGVQPLAWCCPPVQGARGVKACSTKPRVCHHSGLSFLEAGGLLEEGLPVILPSVPSNICPTKPEMCAPRLTPIMCMESRDAPSI